MAFVKLRIDEPINNHPVEGDDLVDFRGQGILPDEAKDTELYFRWYSSLYAPDWDDVKNPDYYSIEHNSQSRPDETFTWQPGIGSHAITFAVSDQDTETQEAFKAIEHCGVTGGAGPGEGQCLVHVFRANPLPPQSESFVPIPRADLYLIAEAPILWGRFKSIENPGEYELNTDYHGYNRLQYRWELIPSGVGETHEYLPKLEDLSFGLYSEVNSDIKPTTKDNSNPKDVFVVYFKPHDVSELSGDYTLRLHAEDNLPTAIGRHTISVPITIIP